MKQYLTYEEYAELGGTLSITAYAPLELKCRKRIDYATDSRVQAMEQVPEAVKLCMMALIGIDSTVGTEAQVSTPTVTSFTSDGYSEHYGNVLNAATAEIQMGALIKHYLFGECDDDGTPLLYRGVIV